MTQQSNDTGRQASLRPTRLTLSVALALAVMAPGAVLAQTADQGSRLLEEVTVTAQRR